MTIVSVPRVPPAVTNAAIKSGAPVTGMTWANVAGLVNHLTCAGSQLVVANSPFTPLPIGTTTVRFYAWPRLVHSRRLWLLQLSASTTTPSSVEVVSAAGSVELIAEQNVLSGVAWYLVEQAGDPTRVPDSVTPTDTPGEISLDFVVSDADCVLINAQCFEVPRGALRVGESNDAAADTHSGFAIYETAERSLYGIGQAIEALRTKQARGLFHWAGSAAESAGSPTAIFSHAVNVLAPAGSLLDGASMEVTVAARLVADSSDASLEIAAASGDTATITTITGSAAWYTTTIEIDREDLSDDDSGGRTGRLFGDGLTFTLDRGTSGTVTCTGLAVGIPAT